MGFQKLSLTNEEKILIYLRDFKRSINPAQAPLEITQEGISKSLGISQSHVSYAVKSLKKKELIADELVHVKGVSRRRKAYCLTSPGGREAQRLVETLAAVRIRLRNEKGEERLVELGETARAFELRPLEVLGKVREDNTLLLSELRGEIAGQYTPEGLEGWVDSVFDTVDKAIAKGLKSTARLVRTGVDVAERARKSTMRVGKEALKSAVSSGKRVRKLLDGDNEESDKD